MEKTLEELAKEIEAKIKQIAILEERNRILREIDEADLPLGVWPLIKDIISPVLEGESKV